MDDQRTDRAGREIRFRKLRIAWSILCGIACVLILGFWFRSYFYEDHCYVIILQSGAEVDAASGQVHFDFGTWEGHGAFILPVTFGWDIGSATDVFGQFQNDTAWDFEYEAINSWSVHAPHWFLALLFAVLAALPWIYPLAVRWKKSNSTH